MAGQVFRSEYTLLDLSLFALTLLGRFSPKTVQQNLFLLHPNSNFVLLGQLYKPDILSKLGLFEYPTYRTHYAFPHHHSKLENHKFICSTVLILHKISVYGNGSKLTNASQCEVL